MSDQAPRTECQCWDHPPMQHPAVKSHGFFCALENDGVHQRPSHLFSPFLLIAPTSGILLALPCVFYIYIFYLKIVFLSVLLSPTCIFIPCSGDGNIGGLRGVGDWR